MKIFRQKRALGALISLITLTIVIASGCSPTATTSDRSMTVKPSPIQKISADEALTLLKDNPQAVLLDVRTAAEYAEGHIEGAQQLAVEDLLDHTDELPSDLSTPIVVYCRSGVRAAQAADKLAGLGYTAIYNLGGINSWPYDVVK